ncbi:MULTISPECIES: outer membrane protein [Roseobacteraceae]|jgi:hypothetical protein|uniref:Outer membrane protein beta-barrel domain protein n=1 Tax=Pseudosulfitobacter pseudonitzschiae TaxID=1402135 RepID=A0A221K0P5_9RHOB|nr:MULTISPECIES: outer membrane beta-barrel protein [Roseobacteraceae]ASM72564.1 outer membrane protein beta-barrel domain protein [Pseudosulfitobacter pseudonitzschiae]
MKRIVYAGALTLAAAAPLYAGAPADPVIEAPVIVPATPAYTGGDWTGFYAGGQLGYADIDGTGAADGSGGTYGVHGGYNYDFGRFVLGGEVDYDQLDIDLGGGGTADNVARLKLKAGYDLGRTLVYATAGAARADTSVGSDNGEFYGLGVAYKVNDRFTMGGEVLEHSFDDIAGSGLDADATSFTLRGSYNF